MCSKQFSAKLSILSFLIAVFILNANFSCAYQTRRVGKTKKSAKSSSYNSAKSSSKGKSSKGKASKSSKSSSGSESCAGTSHDNWSDLCDQDFLFPIDLGFQGVAFELDDHELADVENCVLEFLSANINDDVTTQSVTITDQLSVTLDQTIEEYGPHRKLGIRFSFGSTGFRLVVNGRCRRCRSDRVQSNAINAINRSNRRNRRVLGWEKPEHSVCATDLLGGLKILLPEFFGDVNFVIAEKPRTESELCSLEELLNCLNNNLIVAEGGDPPLKCHTYNLFKCKKRLKPVLGVTERQCRRHVPKAY